MNARSNKILKEDLPVVIPTAEAARILSRSPQTLRSWSSLDNGPEGIRPIRIGNRLLWRVTDLMSLLG